MLYRDNRSVSGGKMVMSLPKAFCEAHNVGRRSRIEVWWDQLLVIIPADVELSPMAEAALKSLVSEGKNNGKT